MKISDSIKTLKGIGPKKYLEFSKLDVQTIEELLYFFPKSYQDRTKIKSLSNCKDQEFAGIIVNVIEIPKVLYIKNNRMTITKALIKDKKMIGKAIWFNMPYVKNNLKVGANYYLYGKIKKTVHGIQIENPDYKLLENLDFTGQGILPLYRLTAKLGQKEVRKFVNSALKCIKGKIEEYLPPALRQKHHLCDINFAIENIHFPKDFYAYTLAKKRLIFDEFFLIQMALRLERKNNAENTTTMNFKIDPLINTFINGLPYTLTKAQYNVVNEIIKDFSSGKIMNRLIQGDVGSGKTIVAVISLLLSALNGYQGAMMVPTEILANQHYLTISKLLKDFNIKVCLLKGSLKENDKSDLVKKINNGEIDIIIGTHAIIQDNIFFYNLGLVITDEQHRFGVKQRELLNKKGDHPHVMVMTATPIPRTLTHILYGDLDISTIDELPTGRKEVKTYQINNNLEKRLYNFIQKQIQQGRQAYIVCPLVEESDNIQAQSVVELKKYLEKKYFNSERLSILHGKLKNNEKYFIMEQFQKGLIDILISTTIVEVGLNVPNASIMVVQNAERFGLAQLHQLRGRVGRGTNQSYCFLITDSKNEITKKRMKTITNTNNGFIIAEKDLLIRGPGEFLGLRQHGLPELKIGNIITDTEIIAAAQKACEEVLKTKEYQSIKKHIEKKFKAILDEVSLN